MNKFLKALQIILSRSTLAVCFASAFGLVEISHASYNFAASRLAARQAGFSITTSQQGAKVTVSWTNSGNGSYYVWVKDSSGAQIAGYWVSTLSTVVILPKFGDFTIFVAPSGQSPATAYVSYIDYATARVAEPYFPSNDTTKTNIAFSWDKKSQDYAYYLTIDKQDGTRVFHNWVYSSTYTLTLPVGAYVWQVTPVSVEGASNVYGTSSPATYFNVRVSMPGMEDLLGVNPLAPSDPLNTQLAYPEDTIRLSDGSWVIADSFHSVLKLYSYNSVTVLAGTGVAGYNGDGPALKTQLNHPTGLGVDASGDLVFADSGNFVIRKLNLLSLTVKTIYGVPGEIGRADSDGNLVDPRLGYLKFIALRSGILYASMQVPIDAGHTIASLYSFDGTSVRPDRRVSSLHAPNIMGFDWAGKNLYLLAQNMDGTASNLVKVDGSRVTTLISTLAPSSSGIAALSTDDVLIGGKESLLEFASGSLIERNADYINIVSVKRVDDSTIAVVDSDAQHIVRENISNFHENIFIKNGANSFGFPVFVLPQDTSHVLILYNHPSYIFRFNTITGETTLVAGSGSVNFATFGIDARASSLRYPVSLAVDAGGNIYIGEGAGIDRIDAASNVIMAFAGAPSVGGFVDNVSASQARFLSINGMSFDQFGSLIVSDTGNSRVRSVANDFVTTIAGTGSNESPKYGVDARTSPVNRPYGAIYYQGCILVPMADENCIAYVDPNGLFWPLAGVAIHSGYQGNGSYLPGPRLSAKFNTPVSIASLANSWDFLVCDSYNNRIRRVNSWVTTILGDGSEGYSPTSMNVPSSVAVSGSSVYVSDLGNGLFRCYPLPH